MGSSWPWDVARYLLVGAALGHAGACLVEWASFGRFAGVMLGVTLGAVVWTCFVGGDGREASEDPPRVGPDSPDPRFCNLVR